MQPDPQGGAFFCIYLILFILRKNSKQNTRQDIATASSGHAGVASGVDVHLPSPTGGLGVVALIDNYSPRLAAEAALCLLAASGALIAAKKAFKLLGMGREDRGRLTGEEVEAVVHLREHVEGIGIQDEGPVWKSLEEGTELFRTVGAQARADSDGIIALEVFRNKTVGPMGVIVVDGNHGLGDGGLHDVHSPAGHMDGEQPHAGAQAGAGGQYGGPHLAIAASNEKGMAISAFVALGRAAIEEIGKGGLLHTQGDVFNRVHDEMVKKGSDSEPPP